MVIEFCLQTIMVEGNIWYQHKDTPLKWSAEIKEPNFSSLKIRSKK